MKTEEHVWRDSGMKGLYFTLDKINQALHTFALKIKVITILNNISQLMLNKLACSLTKQ